MATSRTLVPATPEEVFAVLEDPTTYPSWLVGCLRIREVGPDWPWPGARFHHVVGVGPLRVADRSEVLEVERPWRLVLDVRARPVGRGRATFTLRQAGLDGEATEVTVEEVPTSPVARRLRPLLDGPTRKRNDASLDQLGSEVEARRGRLARFGFRHEGVVGRVAALAGARGRRAVVELGQDELRLRFGPFRLATPLANLAGAEVSGPYRRWRVAGPVRVSATDRGLTFATNARAGVCLSFHEPVALTSWSSRVRHPAATVTVAEPERLAEAVRRVTSAASASAPAP